jgi:hypothetical protein
MPECSSGAEVKIGRWWDGKRERRLTDESARIGFNINLEECVNVRQLPPFNLSRDELKQIVAIV